MKLNGLSQKAFSWCYERYLGIRTTGRVAATVKWGVPYSALPYHIIFRMLDYLSLTQEDVFVDVGCGKGRVVCCASRLHLRKVVAIEVNAELLKLTVDNAHRVRGRKSEVDALAIPAEEYAYPDATVIYLYNPFDRPIMDKVFERIDESQNRRPRHMRIVYANCIHEEPLRQTGWLHKRQEWAGSEFPGFGLPISFWSSKC